MDNPALQKKVLLTFFHLILFFGQKFLSKYLAIETL